MKIFHSITSVCTLLAAAFALHAQVTVDKTALSFSGQLGGSAVQQTINVTTSSSSAVFFSANIAPSQNGQAWLRFQGTCTSGVTGTTGTTPFALTIVADPTCFSAAGAYNGQLTITPQPSGTPVSVPITFTVSTIGVNPSSVPFTYQTGGTVPPAQSVALSGPNVAFTAAAATSSGGNWLTVTPANGSVSGGVGAVSVILDPFVTPTLAPGTYNGTITITPTGSSNNTPAYVPVTLTVTVPPPVTVSSSSLQLNYQISGANNSPQQVLTLSTTSSQALSFGTSPVSSNNPSGRNWILVNPSSGQIPANGSAQVTISYDTTASLPPGTWTGTVTLYTPGAAPQQQTINVSLLVSNQPLLSVSPAGLNFSYELNSGTTPAAQTVTATSTAAAADATSGQMTVTAAATTSTGGNWLAVSPASGSTGTANPFTVSVTAAGLLPGKYQGTVTLTGTGAGNGAQTVPVTLTVANDPLLVTNLSSLTFESQTGQSPVATAQTSQTVTVSSSSGAALNYVATAATTPAGGSWLAVSGNTTASTNNSFTVTVLPASLTAGTYTGTITITATNPATGNQAVNSPLTIPVTLYVSDSPMLVVTLPGNPPSQPVLTAQENGAVTGPQTLTLLSTNPGVGLSYSMIYDTASGGSWLSASPLGGNTAPGSNQINLYANPGILTPGQYSGTVTITASGPNNSAVANSPYKVPITFNVTAGALQLSQSTLQFSQTAGGAAPPTKTVQVTSSGQALNFQAAANSNNAVSWLSVSPATGNTSGSGTLTISVDGSKLAAGTYTGTVTVTSPNASNSPATITVNLTLSAGTIAADQTSLALAQVQNTTTPATKTINVTSTPGSVNFTVAATTSTGGNWLTAGVVTTGSNTVSASGATPASVQVTANAGSLAVGQYSGSVTITSTGAAGSPISIPVTFTVLAPQTLSVTPSGTLAFAYTLGTAAPQAQQLQLTSSGSSTFTATAKTTDGGNWLAVSPASGNVGTTPTPLGVSVSPSSLAAGNYTGTITIASPASTTPLTVNVTLAVTAVPAPTIAGIRNAASGVLGAIAPGEMIAIYGTGIGPAQGVYLQLTSAGKVSTNIGNTQVLFDGIAAPIIYASSSQTNVVVPYEIAGRASTNVTVTYSGMTSAAVPYTVVSSMPGIFTQNLSGTGPGAIVNQDNTVNGPNHAAPAGSVVAVYMTGEGATVPQAITGGVAPGDGTGLEKPVLAVAATVGGQTAKVLYGGSAPNFVYGFMQVNVEIPAGLASGPQPVVITIGGASQSGVTVQVQ